MNLRKLPTGPYFCIRGTALNWDQQASSVLAPWNIGTGIGRETMLFQLMGIVKEVPSCRPLALALNQHRAVSDALVEALRALCATVR